jgi:phenolic acid decarboxylase
MYLSPKFMQDKVKVLICYSRDVFDLDTKTRETIVKFRVGVSLDVDDKGTHRYDLVRPR